ncbi:hypothetical protein HME9304_02728 [Flagellimonas maritima]|uniref:Prepilin-type N-terminal cleavage/methylation domain-containing protein n=1 Tax=Flagellimonas maritima TaxID=1383885 RepID=A0A2Z4LUY6_9FLAO|nr:hypothetical protein [Allomuricauda aurantiaca]AWX45701.1 hypothetical protein HME9304_02728 [Allomuricauda aurantiaca]
MNWIKKTKAFTLNEMVVVLLITTLVVGMAFSVLRLVQQQIHGISVNHQKNTEINLFRQSLWIDFNQFDTVWWNANQQQLWFTNEIRKTAYKFQDEFVIKNRDTFHIKIMNKSSYFNGESKFSGEIDAIDIYMTGEIDAKRIFVFKKNSSTSYINQ